MGFGFLCSALVGVNSTLVGFGFICTALAVFLLCLPPLDLRGLDLVLTLPPVTPMRRLSPRLCCYWSVWKPLLRGGYCHSHQLSCLCTTFPSIPLATHPHSLVNHSHLESISGSSSPVAANQAPHKNMLTPHSHCLVSQLLCMTYLTHLSVYSPLSTSAICSWFSSAPPILSSRLASLKQGKDSLPHPVKLPIHFTYLSTCLNVDVLSTPVSVYNKPAVILTYPCVQSCLLTTITLYIITINILI